MTSTSITVKILNNHLKYLFVKKSIYASTLSVIGIFILILFYYYYSQIAVAICASAVRYSTPLILGALCGLIGERSGVMNIGIEGQMLFAAFTGFMFNVYTGNLFFSVLAGIISGALCGLILAVMCVSLRMDQIIAGSIINILALGITSYLFSASLTTAGKLKPLVFGPLKNIPFLGPVLFNSPPITIITILLVGCVHYALFHTRWGLRTRAVGEHPAAADSLGINVFVTRYMNLTLGGTFAGLAGAFLTLESVGTFERGMTNGRGFVALAVMIFGKWTPLGSWGAALLFGLAIAVQTQLQFEGVFNIPHQFINMIPYILTVLILALFIGRVKPPASIGMSYSKE